MRTSISLHQTRCTGADRPVKGSQRITEHASSKGPYAEVTVTIAESNLNLFIDQADDLDFLADLFRQAADNLRKEQFKAERKAAFDAELEAEFTTVEPAVNRALTVKEADLMFAAVDEARDNQLR